MHKISKVLIVLPVVLAACAAKDARYHDGIEVAPVARETGWAGCEMSGGSFATGNDGGLVCVSG